MSSTDEYDSDSPNIEEVDGETQCKPCKPQRAPELYSEDELATLKLRFAVGDRVRCTIDKGTKEGVILQRFYREREWPAGLYAAYQVRLLHGSPDDDDERLIYAPRDENRYIKPVVAAAATEFIIHVDRRLSNERRLIRELEASLMESTTRAAYDKKHSLMDKLRTRHKEAMRRIIADISLGLASSAWSASGLY